MGDIALKLIDVCFEMFKEILGEGDVGGANDDELGDKVGKEKDDRGEILKDKRGRVIDLGGKKGRVIDLGGKKGKEKEREVTSAAGFAARAGGRAQRVVEGHIHELPIVLPTSMPYWLATSWHSMSWT